MTYIANTIHHFPLAVEVCCDDDERLVWERQTWSDFADANPDIADWVGLQIATHGTCKVGGGAAPLYTVRRARA